MKPEECFQSQSSTSIAPTEMPLICLMDLKCRYDYMQTRRKVPDALALAPCPVTLHDGFQLPGVAQSVFDHHAAAAHYILLCCQHLLFLLWEVYPSIFRHPAARLCELDDCAFRVEEQKVLRVRDRKGRVGALGAGCDFGADRVDENLCKMSTPLSREAQSGLA